MVNIPDELACRGIVQSIVDTKTKSGYIKDRAINVAVIGSNSVLRIMCPRYIRTWEPYDNGAERGSRRVLSGHPVREWQEGDLVAITISRDQSEPSTH